MHKEKLASAVSDYTPQQPFVHTEHKISGKEMKNEHQTAKGIKRRYDEAQTTKRGWQKKSKTKCELTNRTL